MADEFVNASKSTLRITYEFCFVVTCHGHDCDQSTPLNKCKYNILTNLRNAEEFLYAILATAKYGKSIMVYDYVRRLHAIE